MKPPGIPLAEQRRLVRFGVLSVLTVVFGRMSQTTPHQTIVRAVLIGVGLIWRVIWFTGYAASPQKRCGSDQA